MSRPSYRDKIKPLIINEDTEIYFNWSLWGAEVDLIALTLKGNKEKISNEDITWI